MNKEIKHFSLEELRSYEFKETHPDGILTDVERKTLIDEMEKYDPDERKAHEIAKKYRNKSD